MLIKERSRNTMSFTSVHNIMHYLQYLLLHFIGTLDILYILNDQHNRLTHAYPYPWLRLGNGKGTVLISLHLRPINIIMVARWHTCSLCSKNWRRNVARYDSDSFIPVASVKMAAMADGSTYPAIRAAASPGRARASTGQNIQIGVFIFIMDQLHGADCWLESPGSSSWEALQNVCVQK